MLLLALALACSFPPSPATAPAGAPEPTPAATPPVPVAAPTPAEVSRVLAPSPEETRKTLEGAGIAADMAQLVPERSFAMDGPDKDIVAVRTGVHLADAVLSARQAPKEKLLARMAAIQQGLATMGAGAGLLSTARALNERFANDAVSREGLLAEVDAIVGAAVPGEGVGPTDRTGPLLQAGAWLTTANVAARAIASSGKWQASDTMFHQADVVRYFRRYAQGDGAGKAPTEFLGRLDTILAALEAVSAHDAITEADTREIEARTGELLALL
jgi:hypothetical protein